MATYVGCHKAARDLSCVWPTWIRDTFARAHTQLFGGEISESLQSQTTQKQSCSPSSNSSNNKPQISCSCMLPLLLQLQQQQQLQLPSQARRSEPKSKSKAVGECAFCGSGAAFRVFGILRKSFRNICAPNNYGKHFRIRNYLAVSIYLPLRQKEKPFSSYS